MIKHLIKLIWNKKRSNFLLTTEIFVSFLVLFGVMSLMFYNYGNYSEPLGYQYENVWAVYYSRQDAPDSVYYPALDRARQYLAGQQEVEAVSFTSYNTPYSQTTMRWNASYEGRSVTSEMIAVDEDYGRALDIEAKAGRWMSPAEVATAERVVVLNRQAAEALFGQEPALGKMITFEEGGLAWKVVGVLGNFKLGGEFQVPKAVIFLNHKAHDHRADAMLVKVKPTAGAAFESSMLKELSRIVKGANIELSYLTGQRRTQHAFTKVPMILAGTICGFLLLNVGLGLFGVLWFAIRKRREEIGLRRALGATHTGILRHFVGEAAVIASFGMLVGLFFALQLPLLDVFGLDKQVYFQAAAASVLFLLLLVVVCAFYPSRQAARIQPARVLHEE
ncbi:MAG: ABC transporter permease [Phaeodactylibacter sp.]|nr:ABC transporter permease [Phaeodactylibacter sp.]